MCASVGTPAPDDSDPNGKRAGPMAIDESSASIFSPWPDRLRHSAIILLAAGLALDRARRLRRIVAGPRRRGLHLHRRGRAGAVAAARRRSRRAKMSAASTRSRPRRSAPSSPACRIPRCCSTAPAASSTSMRRRRSSRRRCARTNSRSSRCARPKSSPRCAKPSPPRNPGAPPISITCRSIAGWN